MVFYVGISFSEGDIPQSYFLGYGFVFSFFCGYQFPLAADLIGEKESPAAGCLAADFTGAAVGTLATGAILIPLLGIQMAIIFLILVKISSNIIVLFPARADRFMRMTRKEFLKTLGIGLPALLCAGSGLCFGQSKGENIRGEIFRKDAPAKPWKWSVEGFYYTSDGKNVQCQVCPNLCLLEPGDRSVCRSKVNIDGKLYSLAYGNPCSVHVDPIEKKPLNHFYPGTSIFSIATTGCNFRCLNCQNWEISQKKPEEVQFTRTVPAGRGPRVSQEGRAHRLPLRIPRPSLTMSTWLIRPGWAEKQGSRTFSYPTGTSIASLSLSFARSWTVQTSISSLLMIVVYRSLNGGTLQPVLNTLKVLHEQGVWFEITTLVVPTYVEDPEMIKRMCGWILKELGPDYPLHLLRFFPQYRLTRLPPTPVATLEKLREVALGEGLRYVYLGNVPGHQGCNTYCPNCRRILVERNGYLLKQVQLNKGHCKFCNHVIPGRWSRHGHDLRA